MFEEQTHRGEQFKGKIQTEKNLTNDPKKVWTCERDLEKLT